ncbi:MAG: polysaccharide pyruvyl transferase family protein, partial [Bacteroidaceae bacterium]
MPNIYNHFLDFPIVIRKVAYAASFGLNGWDFSEEQTLRCIELARDFKAVSVREDSAIKLCKDYLKLNNVKHVLDPTMLLCKEDYIKIVEKGRMSVSNCL